MNQNIKYQIEKILLNISDDKITNFQNCLESGKITKNSDVYDYIENLHFLSDEIKLARKTLDYFDDSKILSILLEYGREVKDLKNKLETNSSLVWTSPLIDETVSQTFHTMLEMIRSAHDIITIVGYAIWGDAKDIDPNAPKMKEIFEELAKSVKQNRRVELFFEKDEDFSTLKNNVKKMWIPGAPLPKIYGFKKKEKHSSLHAKMLLVDDSEVLVTSANMTGRAITRNVELGIKSKGFVAKNARNLISSLIKADFFEEEKW